MLKLIPVAAALLFSLPSFAADPLPPADGKPAPQARTGMMRYDTNGDGFVDRTEWTAAQEARFKQLDADRDGKLSRDELFARTPATGGSVLPSDSQVHRQSAYFKLLDADNDGFVSKAEFMAQAERNFARCDLDKDDRINSAECRQALRRPSTQPASANR